MEEFNSETDSEYASYWRDWVGRSYRSLLFALYVLLFFHYVGYVIAFACYVFLSCIFSKEKPLCS